MSLLDDMLKCTFGEKDSKLRVTFKKTVKVREYETEVMEVTNELEIDKDLKGMERIAISQILKCQAEYCVYIDMHEGGVISDDEYMIKRNEIEDKLGIIIGRAESVGIDVSKYLKG